MIGSKARYKTPSGNRVSALVYAERAALPVFSVEVVDADGEVVECFDVTGYTALEALAIRRRWTVVP